MATGRFYGAPKVDKSDVKGHSPLGPRTKRIGRELAQGECGESHSSDFIRGFLKCVVDIR